MSLLLRRTLVAALFALSLSGCIDSAAPILTDSQPLLGQTFRLQFFSLRKGVAHDPEQATYVWNGARYAHAGGAMEDVRAFTVHPFEGDDSIVQTVPGEKDHATEYALLHKYTEGVFLVIPIDQDDADEAARAKYCRQVEKSYCRIETREQLLVFARASAAKRKDGGGLVIRLPDRP